MLHAPRQQFLWYTVKEKISLNWRKFCWFKKIFFNVNKSISWGQSTFFWINKTFFNSKKCFLWPCIHEMFFWFKESVFSVCAYGIGSQTFFHYFKLTVEVCFFLICIKCVTARKKNGNEIWCTFFTIWKIMSQNVSYFFCVYYRKCG